MGVTALAAAVGLLIGRLRGGRLHRLGDRRLKAPELLFVGVAPLLAADVVGLDVPVAVVLAASCALLAFAVVNLQLVGMGVVTLGIALNLAVTARNGGMPVRVQAVEAAGVATAEELRRSPPAGRRHLEHPGDRWMVLADIIPVSVPPMRTVVSIGDLVLAVGLADVLFHLTRPRPARAARSAQPARSRLAEQTGRPAQLLDLDGDREAQVRARELAGASPQPLVVRVDVQQAHDQRVVQHEPDAPYAGKLSQLELELIERPRLDLSGAWTHTGGGRPARTAQRPRRPPRADMPCPSRR